MASNNKSLTILEVKDYLGQALKSNLGLFDKLGKSNDEFDNRINHTFSNIKSGFRVIGTLGLAAGGLIAGGLIKATNSAKEFNSEFRELANLNLDKTDAQIKGLQKQVLDSAFAAGRLPAEMSKAFFDIQSGTGKFGEEVDTIAKKTSDFSRAFKVDFPTAVEGAVKGVKNFNLEVSQMDHFFASSVKTVQVGIVTFEQLARVQTDYAGAANTAGQSVDSANKLFAVFTSKAKSAEEAATLTKSAFTDLLKPSTLESFEKLGIRVFDKQTGKVKQLDDIVSQLNDRFSKVRGNDQAVTNLVNQFKGGEGLISLIGEAAKNGDKMLETFSAFDSTEFGLEKAMANAKQDTEVLSEILQNKLNVLFTRLGMEILPHINEGLDYIISNWLPQLEQRLPGIISFMGDVGKAIGKTARDISGFFGKAKGYVDQFNEFNDTYTPATVTDARKELMNSGLYKNEANSLSSREAIVMRNAVRSVFDDAGNVTDVGKAEKVIQKLADSNNAVVKDFVNDIRNQLFNLNVDRLNQKVLGNLGSDATNPPDNSTTAIINKSGGGKAKGSSSGQLKMEEGLRGVVGGSAQQRNVNVTIQKLIGVESLVSTNLQTSKEEIIRIMEEAVIRAIRDTEVALSNG